MHLFRCFQNTIDDNKSLYKKLSITAIGIGTNAPHCTSFR